MFTKVLIANRGAIAVRVERTLKTMNIKSVAIYAQSDQDSLHVENADEAFSLGDGNVKQTYLNVDKVLDIAVKANVDAIHPGYGFLSENTDFARKCAKLGISFIGPTPEQIELFGLKHKARELAQKANVPLLNGSGLLNNVNDAVKIAESIGYPVLLKSTAGGGGIGIRVCYSTEQVQQEFDNVRHLAQANFGDDGVFVEKYIEKARHVEVQIFGNEYGEVIALGERDCSVQRRNQKVVEECPAPILPQNIRVQMHAAAVNLAKTVGYRNAGTVEFLYDSDSQKFYFLEVNTRLQVEHGVTEQVYGVDLVEMMIREAAGELKGLCVPLAHGHAVEVRIYAEDCLNNFRPCTGKIDYVAFAANTRVETWIHDNIEISPLYDPMLAKLIVVGNTRDDALTKLQTALAQTKIYGVATNLSYLSAFSQRDDYLQGNVYTKMLDGFLPSQFAIEVLDGGLQTTVQDCDGMLGFWTVGVPPCGAFDKFSFRLGNTLLGNDHNAAGLEFTLRGGSCKFRCDTSFCLTGANMHPTLDDNPVQMYSIITAKAGQTLSLGECSIGMRCYLTIKGGIDVPQIMGSRSTFIDGKFGGHNGRVLRVGDVLQLSNNTVTSKKASLPAELQPKITNSWTVGVIPGPQPTHEYLLPQYLQTLCSCEYEVNFNSARTGIRLNGAVPQWAREDGGEAGLHPSNIHDNAYAIGALDLTGDQSILLGPDGPSLGGFVCPVVTAKAEMWKLGQLHPGDKVRFALVSLKQAEKLYAAFEQNINGISPATPPQNESLLPAYAILSQGIAGGVEYLIRLQGEENILIEFGKMELDIELRFRAQAVMNALKLSDLSIIDMTPGIRSLQIHFDCSQINAVNVAAQVEKVNQNLPPLENISVPSRIIHLPLSWDDPQTQLAAQRYQQTVRHNAPWCPSNPEFIRRINGLKSIDELKDIFFNASYLVLGLGDVYLGAPVATPVDPRHRLVTTKYNPARPWTPENAVGIGGSYLCVYGMEGPGGYQFVGRTIQMWNKLGKTKHFTNPWLLNFFDQLQFYPCSAEEILKFREDFPRGKFDLKIEHSSFNLGEYKNFLATIKDSTAAFKHHQQASFLAERQRWAELGLDKYVSEIPAVTEKKELVLPPNCVPSNAVMTGSVWKTLVNLGDHVTKGDTLLVLESMKMEVAVVANANGTLKELYVSEGEQVNAGQTVCCIEVVKD